MKVVCGWCRKLLRGGDDGAVSHGMCERCEAKLMADLDRLEEKTSAE